MKSVLLVFSVFLIVMQACNKKMEDTAVRSAAPTASARAASPEHPLAEATPPVQSPAQVPKQAAMGIPKKALQFQDAFFDYDKALIRPEVKAKLMENAKMLKEHPEAKITIEGHCDERGTAEYNLVLGNRRADAVRRFLIDLGARPSQLSTISYGKEKPFCSERSGDCYRENRRAHFVSPGAEN